MNLWGHYFSQNANQKFEGFLPYPLINFQGRNLGNFWLAFWEKRWPHKFILNLTDLYWYSLHNLPGMTKVMWIWLCGVYCNVQVKKINCKPGHSLKVEFYNHFCPFFSVGAILLFQESVAYYFKIEWIRMSKMTHNHKSSRSRND